MLQVYACMIKENEISDVRPGRKLQKVYIKKKLQAGFYIEAKTFQ